MKPVGMLYASWNLMEQLTKEFYNVAFFVGIRKNAKTYQKAPTKIYTLVFQQHKPSKTPFVGTVELRNEKQPPP